VLVIAAPVLNRSELMAIFVSAVAFVACESMSLPAVNAVVALAIVYPMETAIR